MKKLLDEYRTGGIQEGILRRISEGTSTGILDLKPRENTNRTSRGMFEGTPEWISEKNPESLKYFLNQTLMRESLENFLEEYLNELQEKPLTELLKESLKKNLGGITEEVPGVIRERNHGGICEGATREIPELISWGSTL